MSDTIRFQVQHTDTFGGEANYCWLNEEEFEVPSNASRHQIVKLAKELVGMTGVRCRSYDMGDGYELRPVGLCQVIFITALY